MNGPVGWWWVLDAELYSNSIKFFPSCAYELRRSVVQQTRDKNFVFHFFISANVHTTQRPVCTLRAGESQYQSRVAVIIPSWSVVGAGSQGERERHVHRGGRGKWNGDATAAVVSSHHHHEPHPLVPIDNNHFSRLWFLSKTLLSLQLRRVTGTRHSITLINTSECRPGFRIRPYYYYPRVPPTIK